MMVNYGIVNMEENLEIKNLYNHYVQNNENNGVNLNFAENENLFFIINHTNEKFVFKNFKSSDVLLEYLGGLDNSEYFEDISFSFDYFSNYEVKSIQNLFVEENNFSIIKVLISVFYAQMQGKYVLGYSLSLLANLLFFKMNSIKFFTTLMSSSIVFGFICTCFLI